MQSRGNTDLIVRYWQFDRHDFGEEKTSSEAHSSDARPAVGSNSRVGRRGAATQARILDAGVRILEKPGYHCVRVEAIAALADYSRPTFYRCYSARGT